jgi:hypothetical protein
LGSRTKRYTITWLKSSPWIPKWLAGFAPVGKVQQRNGIQDHAKCPRCTEFETTEHVISCQAPNAQRQWDANITKVTQWLTKTQTLPEIQQAILSRIQSWRNQDERFIAPNYRWPGLNTLVLAQDTIGWKNFLEGGVLQEWASKQQEYFDWLQRRNTGKRWITQLIKKLWEISILVDDTVGPLVYIKDSY